MSKKPEVKSVEKAAAVMANEVKASAIGKAVEAKKPEVKEDPKKEVVKEVVQEAAAVKETAQKAVKKVTAKAKKATAKAASKEKEKVQPKIVLQSFGNEADIAEIVEKVKGIYVADGHRESSIKSIQVYIKPEENAAYYVINDKITGQINLF